MFSISLLRAFTFLTPYIILFYDFTVKYIHVCVHVYPFSYTIAGVIVKHSKRKKCGKEHCCVAAQCSSSGFVEGCKWTAKNLIHTGIQIAFIGNIKIDFAFYLLIQFGEEPTGKWNADANAHVDAWLSITPNFSPRNWFLSIYSKLVKGICASLALPAALSSGSLSLWVE